MGKVFRGTKREVFWISLYSLLLGLAVSVTMTIHFKTVWSGPEQNYLMIGLPVLLRGIGFAVPVFVLVWLLNKGLGKASSVCVSGSSFWSGRLSDRGFFFLCWGVLVLCALPYLLTYYPGGIVGDGAETLEYAVPGGISTVSGQWGVTQIMAFRLFLAIGRVFSPDVNVGIFLYTVCSLLLYTAACAAVVAVLRKKGGSSLLLVAFVFMYAFFGHFTSFGMALWKDGLFAAGIIAFSLLLWNEPEGDAVVRKEGHLGKLSSGYSRWLLGTGAVVLFLCFWRNFVGYGLLVAGVVMLLVRKKGRKALAVLLVLVSLFSIVVQGPVYRALGVEEGRISEALSIPIQQVAAVLAEGSEVSEEQGAILYGMLPREEWKSEYRPGISDVIKHDLDDGFLRSHLFGFIKVWLQLLVRHPGTCLKAYLNETLGFWQPYGSYKGAYYDWFLGVEDLYGRGYEQKDLIFDGTGYTMRYGLEDRMGFIPSGTMVWIMLLSFVLVLCRKRGRGKALRVLLPCLCCWVAVMASAPIAYSYRYIEMLAMGFPLFLCVPLVREETAEDAGLLLRNEPGEQKREKREKKEKNEKTLVRCGAVLAALVMVVILVTGTVKVYGFSGGKIEIQMGGSRDNTRYFVQEGISVPEAGFRWTSGDELVISFPAEKSGEGTVLETVIHVEGILGKKQGYVVLDLLGNELASGELTGAGEIRFDLPVEGTEAGFRMRLPDAAVISEVLKHSTDGRKAAMKISRIEMIRKEAKGSGKEQ